MNSLEEYEREVRDNIARLGADDNIKKLSLQWVSEITPYKYAYNFKYLGRPIIQVPQDIMAMQEIIWQVRPDLIIETGIAHGGSLILSAAMLSLLDYCDAINADKTLDPKESKRKVLGLDIDIRSHNRKAIEEHPLAHKIDMLQGSSIDPEIIAEVHKRSKDYERILVCLDSNHTHDHVFSELIAYAPLVSVGSYCVVFDTIIEDLADDLFPDRPWGKGNNPRTAVWDFLRAHNEFEIDKSIENKLLITVAPDGYLKRIG